MLVAPAAVVTVLASSLAGPPRATAAATTLVSPYIVYAGHGVALVAAQTPTGCDELFSSSDLVHWRRILALPRRTRCYFWGSASFVTHDVGWLLGRDAASDATALVHTVDGGAVWRSQPGSSAGSNGGYEQIGFTDRRDGWRQQIAYGANGPFLLEHTTDGGWSWRRVTTSTATGCEYLPYVFASTSIGFAGNGFVRPPTGTGGFYYSWLWRTRDGGARWTRETLPRPRGVTAATPALVGTPSFVGTHGAIPVVYLRARHEVVAIDLTANDGRGWRNVAAVATTGVARAGGPGLCPGSRTITKGRLVAVEGATTLEWWILRPPSTAGQATIVYRLLHQHRHWVVLAVTARALPVWSGGRDGMALWALDGRRAIVTLQSEGYTALFRTTDGGRDWAPITLAG